METAIASTLECVRKWRAEDEDGHARSICVIVSSKTVRDAMARQVAVAGFSTSVIDANQNLDGDGKAIHFATMHRAKGLEFDCVLVVTPASYMGLPEDTEAQRKLIYVALTRAKREAVMLKV